MMQQEKLSAQAASGPPVSKDDEIKTEETGIGKLLADLKRNLGIARAANEREGNDQRIREYEDRIALVEREVERIGNAPDGEAIDKLKTLVADLLALPKQKMTKGSSLIEALCKTLESVLDNKVFVDRYPQIVIPSLNEAYRLAIVDGYRGLHVTNAYGRVSIIFSADGAIYLWAVISGGVDSEHQGVVNYHQSLDYEYDEQSGNIDTSQHPEGLRISGRSLIIRLNVSGDKESLNGVAFYSRENKPRLARGEVENYQIAGDTNVLFMPLLNILRNPTEILIEGVEIEAKTE